MIKHNMLLQKLNENILRLENQQNEIRERLIHVERKLDQLRVAQGTVWQENDAGDTNRLYDSDTIKLSGHYDFGVWGMWFTQNYGAALTSFALCQEIEDAGYRPLLIDMPSIGGERTAWNMDNPDRRFITKFFETTPTLQVKWAKALNTICGAYIMGSDSLFGGGYDYQIYQLNGCVFGESADPSKPLISFSTSFGTWVAPDFGGVEERYVSSLLKRFQHISIREQTGVEMCKKTFSVNASWTLDPVFLLPQQRYVQVMEKDLKLPEHYVFAYILQPKKDKMNMLKYIADKYRLPVVCVSDMNEDHLEIYGDFKRHKFKYIDKMEVSSWLTYVKSADLVVSDSYHGMCFSLIFEKQFLALYPRDGLTRFSDLVTYLGINKRFNLSSNDDIDAALLEPVDYSVVNKKLKEKVDKDRVELEACLREAYVKAHSNPIDDDPEKLKKQIIYNRALKELG